MSRKTTIAVKTYLVASTLTVALAGAARADDSSMSRFGGDSYNYFSAPTLATAPSSWRLSHPLGASETALEAQSSEQLAAELRAGPPAATVSSDPTFRKTHPNGYTEHELQALSSEASPWQLRSAGSPVSLETTGSMQRAQDGPRIALRDRLAALFHRGADDAESTSH